MLALVFCALAPLAASAELTVNRVRTIDQFRLTAAATAFSGALIAFATEDRTVRIFDPVAMSTRFQLVGHPQPVTAVAFNRAGTLLATADASARLYLWDVKTGKKVREFSRDKGHTKGIIGIAFSPDGTKIATVGDDDAIKVWKTAGGNPIGTILGKGDNLYGIAWSTSGAILTSSLADGLRVYNGQTFQLAAKMALPGGQGSNSIATNRDGTVAVTAGRDGKLVAWNVPGRKKTLSLPPHNDWVIKAAVSPNGAYGASSSADGTTVIWNLKSGASVAKLTDTSPVGSPVGFTGDGRFFIATSASDALQVYAVTPPVSSGGAATVKTKAVKKKK
ncbi:MAG: WD40 repeat domain-containing protein [Armatimonadetes bacterium]|nr:WD40 repeat domain-containing protein [Armatimonadota bacterium]